MTERNEFAGGRPLRLGFLSAIRHGAYLAEAFAARPDVEIVGIADEPDLPARWADVGPNLAAKLGVAFSEDIAGLLARDDIDAICVASEYARHGRLALQALAAGKHVYLDKPMAITVDECRAVAAAAAEAERRGAKVLTFSRFGAPSVQRALAAIRAGEIGQVRAVSAEYTASYGPGEQYDPEKDINWHPRFAGGGEILNFALYPLTNVRLLAGQDIRSVQCFGGALFNRAHRELGIEDMATIILRLSDGAVASIVVGRCHTPNHPTQGVVRATVTGTKGMVDADELRPALAVYGSSGVIHSSLDDENALIRAATDRFVDWVRNGIDPGQSYRDSLQVMEASFAAEESLRNGGKVVRMAG
ncbi:MAG: myo-inositol 2-dehydrogenase / D-chiro-inositol 1-dehydrogenase [Thermomicrobiales bacterium]|jgi:predicted dehydrogenase|nr:myo-inositol 2-dehydrogenase / D-chiro-inositol 1-dehydrogenase [Thermomicrobiales bacterium]MEA2530806.1 myo-inositol 2-dehydrogenase / D-chiro-inositol 1-dehydrogenase [Thermomicrobiales bacterium]